MSKTATVERLTSLRLHGMVAAWTDLIAQGESSIASSKWLIDHLLDAEETDRAMRSIRHQLSAAKLPIHRDLTGFDFSVANVDGNLVTRLATLEFTDTADNVVLVGGPGTGKPIWRLLWPTTVSFDKDDASASTRQSIWSTPWKRKSAMDDQDGWPNRCYGWTSSFWMNWAICPSAKRAAPCYSISCPSSTSAPA